MWLSSTIVCCRARSLHYRNRSFVAQKRPRVTFAEPVKFFDELHYELQIERNQEARATPVPAESAIRAGPVTAPKSLLPRVEDKDLVDGGPAVAEAAIRARHGIALLNKQLERERRREARLIRIEQERAPEIFKRMQAVFQAEHVDDIAAGVAARRRHPQISRPSAAR